MKIGFLGPPGSYSHEAASRISEPNDQLLPFSKITDVFDASVDTMVVPFENSTFGIVRETFDCLKSISGLYIQDQLLLSIQHCVLSKSPLQKIKRALGQCSKWLSQYSFQLIPTDSTSKAAELCSLDEEGACIASFTCAKLYGLDVLAKGVQDRSDNTTRFVVLSKNKKEKHIEDTVLICFTCASLNDVLRVFLESGVQLLRMDTRPSIADEKWYRLLTRDYVYFVECKVAKFEELESQLSQVCKTFRLLGSYSDTIQLTTRHFAPPYSS